MKARNSFNIQHLASIINRKKEKLKEFVKNNRQTTADGRRQTVDGRRQTADGRRVTRHEKLKKWIISAKKSGTPNSEIRRKLELIGWNSKEVDKLLAPRIDFVFLFAVYLAVSLFAVLYYGPALLGAFAGVENWENKMEIAISSAKQTDTEHIAFGNFRPASCADGIYIEAIVNNSATKINFTAKNEIYENNLCKETDIEFENIGYIKSEEREANSEQQFSSQPIELTTYIIYYGKIIQEEKIAKDIPALEENIPELLPEKEINPEIKAATTSAQKTTFGAAAKFRILTESEILQNDTSWQMFHHDFAHTGFYNLSGPTSATNFWNFTTTVDQQVQSSPAIFNGIVYVGSFDDMVYAINATNGSKIWNFTAFDVISSPAVVNNVVYIGANNLQLYALNATNGSSIWNFTLGSALANALSSPTPVNDIVYIGAAVLVVPGYVYAINATNGTQIWRYSTGGANIQSSPAVANNMVYVGDGLGFLYALNATNGSLIWSVQPTTGTIDSTPALDGIIYVGVDDIGLIAYNATNGTQLWNYTMGVASAVNSTPAIANGIVYFSSDPSDATFYALNATNGNMIWNRTNFRGGTSSPAVSGNGIVYVGEDVAGNTMRALNATNGTELWNLTIASAVKSSPALATLSGRDNILAVGANNGIVYSFIYDVTPPNIVGIVPANNTGFAIGSNINMSAKIFDISKVSAASANITLPNGTVVALNLSAVSDTTYSAIFNTTGLNGTYTARFIANDTYNNLNTSETTSFLVGGSTYIGVAGYNFTLENNLSAEVTRDAQVGVLNVLINETATNLFVARLKTNFAANGTVNMSGLIANSSLANKKSVLFRQGGYPANIISKDLFMPTDSFGLGMFICPIATTLNDVNDSCTSGYADVSDTPIIIGTQQYAIAKSVNGTGGLAKPYWTMFHHDLAHAGFNNITGPTTNKQFWNFTTTANQQVQSSPAIFNGIVYVGSFDDMVYAINATNGSKIWNFTAFDVISSPAVVNNVVYIGANNLQLYALNATNGSRIWNYTLGSQLANALAAPAVSDNKVYMPAGDANTRLMYAFNATNGTQIWNFSTLSGNIQSSPAVVDNRVYFGDGGGNIYALNATNGSQIWSAQPTTNAVDSSPAVVGDRVYIGADAIGLIVYNATNGTQLWNYSVPLPGIQMRSSPAVANGIVYFTSKSADATFYALNATNGNMIWNRTNFQGGTSSPAVSGNGIVYIGEDIATNTIHALNATNGTQIWNLTVGGAVTSSPALGVLTGNDNLLVVGANDGIVYAFISNVVPNVPTLNLPTNDSLETNRTPIFNWTIPVDDDNDTLHFEFLLANDSDFSQIVYAQNSSSNATNFNPTPPAAQNSSNMLFYLPARLGFRQYFWHVRAYDGLQYGNFSAGFQFNVTTSVACSISVLNISLGTSISPFTATNYNASLNYAGASNGTYYNITSSSNVDVNITHKGTNMTCTAGACNTSSDYIDVNNVSWKSSTTSATDSALTYANRISLQGAYDAANQVAANLVPDTSAWLRFWLAIRGDQGGGNYTGAYTARCIQA